MPSDLTLFFFPLQKSQSIHPMPSHPSHATASSLEQFTRRPHGEPKHQQLLRMPVQQRQQHLERTVLRSITNLGALDDHRRQLRLRGRAEFPWDGGAADPAVPLRTPAPRQRRPERWQRRAAAACPKPNPPVQARGHAAPLRHPAGAVPMRLRHPPGLPTAPSPFVDNKTSDSEWKEA